MDIPSKRASRRTIQGQTVRQPNQSPGPPATPDLLASCISSPCRNTHHRLSEHRPGPGALTMASVALLNSSAVGQRRTVPLEHGPRSSHRKSLFWSVRLLGPIRVPAFVKLRHECVCKDVYHFPLLPRVHESARPGLNLCLYPQAPCRKRHGAQWHLEHKKALETFTYARRPVPLDNIRQGAQAGAGAEAKGWPQMEF